jgi:UPF0716 protein FxsA
MAIFILIIFIAVPIVEIGVFIELGSRIGLWNTISLIVLTAILGTWLLRSQGLRTLQRAQECFARNEFPMDELFNGLCLLVAGALLLTPGFVTDAIGFLLFVPFVRGHIRHWAGRFLIQSPGADPRGGGGNGPGNNTIEGDFHVVTPDDEDRKDKNDRLKP